MSTAKSKINLLRSRLYYVTIVFNLYLLDFKMKITNHYLLKLFGFNVIAKNAHAEMPLTYWFKCFFKKWTKK